MVEVRLFAQFREGRDKISFLPQESFSSPRRIIAYLGIDEKKVAIILVNGFHKDLDHPLEAGDILALFPPIAGG